MRPLKTLNSSNSTILGSGRPMEGAAGLGLRRRGLVAGDHLVDVEKIFGVALALGEHLTHEGRGHELMIALAVIAFVGLELHFGGELEIAERAGEDHAVDRFLAIGNERERVGGGVAEPVARGWNLAVIAL